VCTTPQLAFQTCQTDANCSVAGDVCCGIYSENVCMPPSVCPKQCALDSQCNTANGEACCLSVKAVEPRLKAAGLCLSASAGTCPKACKTSNDCTGQLCCNGICSTTCEQQCQQSSDCTGQICCKAQTSTPGLAQFAVAQGCTGTPLYACATECSAGCTQSAGGAMCANYPSGCVYSTDSVSCGQHLGCTWDGLECTGTPTNCPTLHLDETSCYADLACEWNLGTGTTCTGTPTPCSQLTPTTCGNTVGCSLSSGGITPT
jgi:hypothetical protein